MATAKKWNLRLSALWILSVVFLLISPSLHAQERSVKIGLYENEPKIFSGPDGRPKGFFADLIRYVAAKENWNVEWVPGDWSACLERLESGRIDLMVDVGYSQERAERFDFTRETALTNWAILYVQPGSDIDSIIDLEGKRIAVLKGDVSYQEFKSVATRFDVDCRFVETSDFLSVFNLIHEKKVDAGLISRLFGYRFEKKFDVLQSSVICCPSELRFAAAKGKNSDLIAALDKHLAIGKEKPHSFYHDALNLWIGSEGRSGVFHKMKFALIVIFGVAAYLFGTSLLLKSRIRARTRELYKRNEDLKREITSRQKAEKALRESEQRYALALRGASDGLWDWNLTTNEIHFSPRWKEMLGYSDDQLPNSFDQWEERVHPEDIDMAWTQIRAHLEGRTDQVAFEHRMKHKNGSYRWILSRGVCVRDPKGRPIRMAGSHTDISDRKEMEEALFRSEEKYRTIFESAQVGLARIDRRGKFLDANQTMAEVYGYDTPARFMDELDMDSVWPDPADRARMEREILSTGTIRDFEVPLYRRDRSVFWARIYGKHLPEYGFFEIVLIDITERKKALHALEESVNQNRALLNAIPDLMFHFSRDGVFLNFKEPKGQGLFLPPETFLGKKLDQVLPPGIATLTQENITRALETGEVQVFEYQLPSIHQEGEVEDFEARVVACGRDEALSIVRDITQRKQAEQALRESENKYRTIFETTGTATVLFGEDMIITLSNSEFTSLSGYSRDETEGKLSWTRIFDEESVLKMIALHQQRSKDPDSVPRTYEATIVDKSGRKHDGVINIGMVPGTRLRVASFLDLTEKKKAEQQMFRTEKMAALGQIIAGVAHEINNPNNFIYFNLPILKRYIEAARPLLEHSAQDPADLKIMNMPMTKWFDDVFKLMDNMQYGSKRITGIVSELKTYIRSHEVQERKPEKLDTVIDHIMTLVGKQVKKMVRFFDVDVAPSLPEIRMNAGKIEQVLINLLINAGQAADKEDSRVRLDARMSEQWPGQVEIRIEDNGSGIPEDILQQIFDPFFTTKGRESGTGLGLSIAHRIIEEHEGTIDVSSRVGKGATFVIRLPVFHGETP